jgi:hypothetical protein
MIHVATPHSPNRALRPTRFRMALRLCLPLLVQASVLACSSTESTTDSRQPAGGAGASAGGTGGNGLGGGGSGQGGTSAGAAGAGGATAGQGGAGGATAGTAGTGGATAGQGGAGGATAGQGGAGGTAGQGGAGGAGGATTGRGGAGGTAGVGGSTTDSGTSAETGTDAGAPFQAPPNDDLDVDVYVVNNCKRKIKITVNSWSGDDLKQELLPGEHLQHTVTHDRIVGGGVNGWKVWANPCDIKTGDCKYTYVYSMFENAFYNDSHWPDISLVDGFIFPLRVQAILSTDAGRTRKDATCNFPGAPANTVAQCVTDLNPLCPQAQATNDDYGNVIACRQVNADTPGTSTQPLFFQYCPDTYTFSWDDQNENSQKTIYNIWRDPNKDGKRDVPGPQYWCPDATDYTVTFCPAP